MASITDRWVGRARGWSWAGLREWPLAASVHWITLGLILVAFAIRAYDLDARSLWIDEGLTFYRATKDLPFILTNRIVLDTVVTTDVHPPLYFILLHWMFQGVGATPFVSRLFSILVSLPTVPLLFVIGRRLGGGLAGVCAALVGAVAPVYLWYAQEARPYALLVTLSLISVYALLRLLASDGRDMGRLRWGSAYVLATAATVYTHYSGLLLLGFQGLFVLVVLLRRRRRWVLVLLAGAAVLISPVIPFIVRRMGTGAEYAYSFVPLKTLLWDLVNGFSLGISVRAEQVWWLDVLFLLIAVVGLAALTRAGRGGWALWIAGYFAVPTLTLYAASYIKPLYMVVRHLIIISPAYYLALGIGLAALARWRRPAFLAGLAVILLGAGYSTHNYFTDPAYLKDDHRSLANYLEEHVRHGDVVVVDGAIHGPVLDVYYDSSVPLVILPPLGVDPGPETLASLKALAEQYERIWFAYGIPGDDWVNAEGERPIRAWRKQALFPFARTDFPAVGDVISLQGFLTRSPIMTQLPNRAIPMETNLEGRLELAGVEVRDKEVAAGKSLDVTLYWRAQRPLENYRVVLRLLDARGRRWAFSDQKPFDEFFPSSHWPVGEIVAWRQSAPVDPAAPPGEYTLAVWVYAPASGQALDVIGPDGNPSGQRVNLGRVTVTRPGGSQERQAGQPTHLLRAHWSNGIDLVGYDQPVDTVSVGNRLPLNLYFAARAKLERDLRLRLRLVDAAGREAAGLVAPPVSAGYPTSQWQPGDLLKGQHSLRVPAGAAPGTYQWCLRLEDESETALSVRRGWWPFASEEICFGQVRVEAPPVADAPADIPHSLEADFGEQIQLLGYDLSNTAVQPGETIVVTLFWQAQAPVGTSYKVTVQLLSPENNVLAQEDSVPAGWTRPTTGWRPGEVITDERTLIVGSEIAAGHYRLIVGLYDEQTGQRLPVTSAAQPADHVVLAEVIVENR